MISALLLAVDRNYHLPATLAGGCLLAGLVLTGIGFWQRRTVMALLANGKRATATAVDSVRHAHDAGDESHHIVWQFVLSDGTAVEHEGLASGVESVELGQTAKLIYDPADPYNARLETLAERTLAWALFLYSGLALLGIAAMSAIVGALT